MPGKEQSFNRSNAGFQSRSLIEYYLTFRTTPPRGSVIVSLLLTKEKDSKTEKLILSRGELKNKLNPRKKFETYEIWLGPYTSGQCKIMVNFPLLRMEEGDHVREWRKEVRKKIFAMSVNHNVKQLLTFLIPDEIHEKLEQHTQLDALLDEICLFFERLQCVPMPIQPLQEDFVFIRDYIEAVENYIKQICPTTNTLKYERNLKVFVNAGLSPRSSGIYSYGYPFSKDQYLEKLELIEMRLLAQLKNSLNEKTNMQNNNRFHKGRSFNRSNAEFQSRSPIEHNLTFGTIPPRGSAMNISNYKNTPGK